MGSINLKDVGDNQWYSVQVSGSSPNAIPFVNPTPLSFGTSSYYDQNYPYQLLAGSDGNVYKLELSASTLVVSQSIYSTPAFVIDVRGAVIYTCKPSLLFQSITDGDFYGASIELSGSEMALVVSQTVISQSLIKSIY